MRSPCGRRRSRRRRSALGEGAWVVMRAAPPRAASSAGSSSAGWPVRARNTSSRLGCPTEKSAIRTPDRASSATASAPRSASTQGAESAAESASRLTAPSWRSRIRSASGRWSGSISRTCSAPEPTDALSWPGVPSAITRPWSITAMPSARWSASSRYWVQSRIVVPPSTKRPDDVPDLIARTWVEAGRGLVEEHQPRGDDDARGDVEPPAHPARVVLDEPRCRVGQAEGVQQLGGARLRLIASQPQEPGDEDQVLAAGQVLVDRRELAGEADIAADLVGVGDDVVAEDPGAPLGGPGQGGEHPDRRRLAGAVGPEDAVDAALGHREVDPVDGANVAEVLDEAACLDRKFTLDGHAPLRVWRSVIAR